MSKKNKSNIKYGAYIYNELKTKQKDRNTDTSSSTSTDFLTILGSLINNYRKNFLPVFTLGGVPIDDGAYDRNTSVIRKSLQQYFEYSNTLLDNSYYDITDTNLEDYFFLCDTQDAVIEESFKDYEPTDEEFINSILNLDENFLNRVDDFYNSITNNPYTIT